MTAAPHVITLGFAKSGTTLLHRMFDEHSPLVVPKRRKELKYFTGDGVSREEYLAHFDLRPDTTTYEGSPQYLTAADANGARETMRRIKRVLGDVKVIICLRHPVSRAFSHYIHNLQFFSRFGHRHSRPKDESLRFKRVYERTFEQALQKEENIGTLFYRKCADAVDIFGREHCRFFLLERDKGRPEDLAAELTAFLNVHPPLEWTSFPRVYSGLCMPRYVFGGSDGRTVSAGGRTYRLAPGSVLVACDMETLYLPRLSEAARSALDRSQSHWTRELSDADAEKIYEARFRNDFERTLRLAAEVNEDAEILSFYATYPPRGKTVPLADPDPAVLARRLSPDEEESSS